MTFRSAYATGPRWVRIAVLLAAGVIAAVVLVVTTSSGVGTGLAFLALGLGIVAAVAEPWDRRRLARATGWHGDLAALVAVAAEVDSGRVPDETEQHRELARRYAADRLENYRGGQKFAVIMAVITTALVVIVALGAVSGESILPLVPGLILLVSAQYRLWVLRPRYKRTLQTLRNTEWEWAQQPGRATPAFTGDHPGEP